MVAGLDGVCIDPRVTDGSGVTQPSGHGPDVGAAGDRSRDGEVTELVQVAVEPDPPVDPGKGV